MTNTDPDHSTTSPPRVLVTGARGLIGRALVPALEACGCRVTRLVHGNAPAPGDISWQPGAGGLVFPPDAAFEAVVHLAGENVASGRWTPSRCAAIRDSRVAGTGQLVQALAGLPRPPRVFVGASAVGFYGDRGDTLLTEAAPPGTGFLAETCMAWERETLAAAGRLGARVVVGRIGIVLSGRGGALDKMLPVFRAGLGGPLAGGRGWMSWVADDDVVAMLVAAVLEPRWAGVMNFVAPEAVTNAEFTRALAGVLGRPAILPVPRWVLRARFGRMADEALLASTRVVPEKLLAAGFKFSRPRLEPALRALLAG